MSQSKWPPALVLLYAIDDGDIEALDGLLDRMAALSAELVSAAVQLLGHAPERSRVERIVVAIASRTWSLHDRVSIAGAFATGLTHRIRMFGLGFGTLEPIPLHPGRSASHELLKKWLAYHDYGAIERPRMVLDAVRLGIADARKELRSVLEAALAAGAGREGSDAILAAQAIEILHADGERLGLNELEYLVRNNSYLAASVVAVIAAGGTQTEADSLMRLYEEVNSGMLQSVILSHLEPLASHIRLRITRKGKRLSAVLI